MNSLNKEVEIEDEVVPFTDTVPYPGAMMIVGGYAMIALLTVLAS